MATTTRKFKIPLGFYVPGIFAGLIKKLATDGEPAEAIDKAVQELQGFHYYCCPCSPQVERPVTLFTARQARHFSRLARKVPYIDLLTAVEQFLATRKARCPTCRRAGKLRFPGDEQRNSDVQRGVLRSPRPA